MVHVHALMSIYPAMTSNKKASIYSVLFQISEKDMVKSVSDAGHYFEMHYYITRNCNIIELHLIELHVHERLF